jgi:hypothetical protein
VSSQEKKNGHLTVVKLQTVSMTTILPHKVRNLEGTKIQKFTHFARMISRASHRAEDKEARRRSKEVGRAMGVEKTRSGGRTAEAQAAQAAPFTVVPELQKPIAHTVPREGARGGREGQRRMSAPLAAAVRQRARGDTSWGVCPMALLILSLPLSLPCPRAAPRGFAGGQSGRVGQGGAGWTGGNVLPSVGLLLRRRLRGGDGMCAAEQVSTATSARDERHPCKHAQVYLLDIKLLLKVDIVYLLSILPYNIIVEGTRATSATLASICRHKCSGTHFSRVNTCLKIHGKDTF